MKTQKVMDVNGKIHKTIIKKFVYQWLQTCNRENSKKQEMLNNILININKLGSLKG
jgi:hypothetical protein